jgi:hypothetical protein
MNLVRPWAVEAIPFVDDKRVELVFARIAHHLLESGTFVYQASETLILVDLDQGSCQSACLFGDPRLDRVFLCRIWSRDDLRSRQLHDPGDLTQPTKRVSIQ